MACNDNSEIRSILEQGHLTPLFQPILDLKNGEMYGYEALIRGPSDSNLHSPMNLFDAATRCGCQQELETACRRVSVERFVRNVLPGRLFLNVSPLTLMTPGSNTGNTLDLVRQAGMDPSEVVIELSEQQPISDYNILREVLTHFREQGFKVAMDDLGAGYASLRAWSELRPDFVKIDMHFVMGVDTDPVKRQFLHSMQEIALGLGCHLVAEGIETAAELETVKQLGIAFGQGYFIARPSAAPVTRVERLEHYDEILHRKRMLRFTETVQSLARTTTTVEPHESVNAVAELFQQQVNMQTLPVIYHGKPLGLVERNQFMQMYASRYGRELHGRQPIAQYLSPDPIIIDQSEMVEVLSQRITSAHRDVTVHDDFIITNDGRYVGVGSVLDLLRKITELQIRNARYANPLTLLPGNVPIYERIEQLLKNRQAFSVLYFDIDNFKPFNDKYGYARGDDVIRSLADQLQRAVEHCEGFVGHIGGDDFILVLISADWESVGRDVLRRFDHKAPGFYDDTDRHNAGISGHDRRGNEVFYPLISISAGAVQVRSESLLSRHDIAFLASEAKSQAKKHNGSYLFIDRREHLDPDERRETDSLATGQFSASELRLQQGD